MKRQPIYALDKKKFPGLTRDVKRYHNWHGDTKVHVIGLACDPSLQLLPLARYTDEQGEDRTSMLSCILMPKKPNDIPFLNVHHYDVSELTSVLRADEEELYCPGDCSTCDLYPHSEPSGETPAEKEEKEEREWEERERRREDWY